MKYMKFAVPIAAMICLTVLADDPSTWWVDRTTGDNEYSGSDLGTAEHPYASIQAAVNRAVDGDTVKVRPGDYDNGGYVDGNGCSNRVYIAKKIHLVSTGGAAVTTIRGKFDSGDTALNGANVVGDGVRCVRVYDPSSKTDGYGAVVEGFTLVDGYAKGPGGAIKAELGVKGAYFVDCIITNCTGTSLSADTYGVVVGGVLVRCMVTDSPKSWSIHTQGYSWNSVFTRNNALRGVFGYSSAVNCSLAGNDGCSYVYFGDARGTIAGVVTHGKPVNMSSNASLKWTNSVRVVESVFVDSAAGDWRLLYGTEADGIAEAVHLTNVVNFADAAFPIAFTDYNHQPLPTEGRINGGAVQEVRRVDWYVNAATGSDSNDGLTPATPFATLAAASTNAALMAGDTIHVSEGVYSNGVVAAAAGKTVGARAYVKSRVALVADGAKENTVIVGAEATGGNIEETTYNTGSYAVRGVFLEDKTTVRGFTIRGGRTRGNYSAAGSSMYNFDFVGAGVCGSNNVGADHRTRIVEDCVISNNVASWGGAASGVRLVRCCMRYNGATRIGGSTYYASHESCYIAAYLSGAYQIFYPYVVLNTTIVQPGELGACHSRDSMIPTNSLFLAKVTPNQYTTNAVNCIFKYFPDKTDIIKPGKLPENSTSRIINESELLLENYRPQKTSPVVDFCLLRQSLLSDKDLDGNPRVLNGKVDCGCYEYDWRRDYAADIGARGLTVASASPDVVETNGVVRLVGGCEALMSWTLRSATRRVFPVTISGSGTLSAYVNGVLVATLTAADSSFMWNGAAGTDEIRLVFSGDGWAELGRPKNLAGMMLLFY